MCNEAKYIYKETDFICVLNFLNLLIVLISLVASVVYRSSLFWPHEKIISAPPGEASHTRTNLHIRNRLLVKWQHHDLAINTLQPTP